jgi:hypothetical protein
VLFDQADFLFAAPTFDFLFAGDGVLNVAEGFEVDEAEDAVTGSEAWDETLAMFDHSAFEVVCYARVEGAGTAGEDVDGVVVVHEKTGKSGFLASLGMTSEEKSGFLTREKAAGSE